MTARPDLADRLALRLLDGPCSGAGLARRVGARKADVVEALHQDPRFDHSGRGRGSRWRLRPWEQMGTEDRPGSGLDDVRAELDLLRLRVDLLERRLAETETAH